ncbi:MAG TPA: wax ester/triacylglycerol synthase family O-acyltransferase, partial [Acidimicrobiales bacterium]|nr:wax ester/triacylglycerol synthase family O-acyltransferase [Acidimicrobiales bacterium]
MKQLSGLDAVFLYTETPVSAGHVSSLSIYTRPDGDDGTYDPYRAMADQIRSRLPLLEPFRRRLVTVPLDLDHPYWIRDPDFDLEFHLRSAPVPAP